MHPTVSHGHDRVVDRRPPRSLVHFRLGGGVVLAPIRNVVVHGVVEQHSVLEDRVPGSGLRVQGVRVPGPGLRVQGVECSGCRV